MRFWCGFRFRNYPIEIRLLCKVLVDGFKLLWCWSAAIRSYYVSLNSIMTLVAFAQVLWVLAGKIRQSDNSPSLIPIKALILRVGLAGRGWNDVQEGNALL